MENRRRQPRFKIKQAVIICIEGKNDTKAFIRNISLVGAGIVMPFYLNPKTMLEIRFNITIASQNKNAAIESLVRYYRQVINGYEIGVEFINLADNQQRIIEYMISTTSKKRLSAPQYGR